MKPPLVTLMCGPAGAGKTTHARSLEASGAVRLSMDEAAWRAGYRGLWPPRDVMDELDACLQQQLRQELRAGSDVVVDISSSTRAVRDVWRDLAHAEGARWQLVVVRAPLPVLLQRVSARRGAVDANAWHLEADELRRYVEGFQWPGADEPHHLITTA